MRSLAASLLTIGALLGVPWLAVARSKDRVSVDRYCQDLQNALRSQTPIVFTGPDPWVESDDLPDAVSNQAFAFLYSQGPSIRWVFLRITEESDGWTEDVNYFFGPDGAIVKRTRELRVPHCNIELDVTTYYANGEVAKERTKKRSLVHGKQDASEFSDPDAPTMLNSDELPFGPLPDLWQRLA